MNGHPIRAERDGQLDPQSLVVQSVGVLIGSLPFIAGKLPWSFGCVSEETLDNVKCQQLKADLSRTPENLIVPIERFFDGNDDLGSIGCNLIEHPGIDTFREILTGLLQRSDVEAVYALICEVDPGEGSWPFTDTVLVLGTISEDELSGLVRPLDPDEVGSEEGGDSSDFFENHSSPVSVIWWD